MEYNASDDVLEQEDNTQDDEELFQLLMKVVRRHVVVEEEVDPLLQVDDYRAKYHTHYAAVEQKDKPDRRLGVPCHLLSVQFCTENRLHVVVAVVVVHQHMHLEGVKRYRKERSVGNQYTCRARSIVVRSIMSSCRCRWWWWWWCCTS